MIKNQKMIIKNLLFLVISATSFSVFSQTNTLPTNGNVGIGTTSPDVKLDVRGDVNIDSSLVVSDSAIFNSNALVKDNITVQGETRLEDNTQIIKDFTVDGATILNGSLTTNNSLKFNGVSSINTNTIGTKFLIVDSNGIVKSIEKDLMLQYININQGLSFCNPDDALGNVQNPFWNNGLNKLFNSCDLVKVGIGTSNPTHKLTLIGDQYTEGNQQVQGQFSIGEVANGFSRMTVNSGSYGAAVEIKGNNSIYNKLLFLHVNGSNNEVFKVINDNTNKVPFIMKGDGSFVFSNYSTKILQLDTTGLLHARKIKVDVETWPDYVFDSNYKLMPIKDVKAYIAKENHLPGIPSALEMEKEGLDLAQSNKLLIEKIEELMLYIINQQGDIEALKSEVEILKNQLK